MIQSNHIHTDTRAFYTGLQIDRDSNRGESWKRENLDSTLELEVPMSTI